MAYYVCCVRFSVRASFIIFIFCVTEYYMQIKKLFKKLLCAVLAAVTALCSILWLVVVVALCAVLLFVISFIAFSIGTIIFEIVKILLL